MKYSFGMLTNKKYNGKYAVFSGQKFFPHTVTDSPADAEYSALVMSAHWHRQQCDKIHAKLDALGHVSDSDPYGYMC